MLILQANNFFSIDDPFELIHNSYEWTKRLKLNKLSHFDNLFNIFTDDNMFADDSAAQDSFLPKKLEVV